MTFGMDGPQVTGWWVNPKTGDKFKAIDTFFEDNQLLVKAADGRLIRYDKMQDYIKTDKPDDVIAATKKTSSKTNNNTNALPPEILEELERPGEEDLIIPDDNIYTQHTTPVLSLSKPAPTMGNIYDQGSDDMGIIGRALKNKPAPTINCGISWSDFPKREVEMLIDVMGVNIDDVIKYYINNLNVSDIQKSIKQSVMDYIQGQLDTVTILDEPVVEQPVQEDEVSEEIEVAPKKPTGGKTSKKKSKKLIN